MKQLSNTQMNDCTHISKQQWNEIMRSLDFSHKTKSLLFIDKFNVKPLYVPSSHFSYQFSYNEFNDSPNIGLSDEEFEDWFENYVRDKTQYLRIHVCNPHEIMRKLVIKCPNLKRINFHYFILNKDCIEILVDCCQSLESINFENSIGIHLKSCGLLSKLPNLKHLNLIGSDIYEDSLRVLLKNCQCLESLSISNNPGITGHCLVYINPSIKRIDIRDCWRIGPQQVVAMAQLGLKSLIEFLTNSGINDQSLIEVCTHCPNIVHLNISFDDFIFSNSFGENVLTTSGFSSIGKLEDLKRLTLRHVGKLNDQAMQNILKGCRKLTQFTVNVRHRHQLTDMALTNIGNLCPYLVYLESVHNHYISKLSLISISELTNIEVIILRGDQSVDDDVVKVINQCKSLININLDGCNVGESVLCSCIERAKELYVRNRTFRSSLIHTNIDRSSLKLNELPSNLRVRVSGPNNLQHFAEFDGQKLITGMLRDKFYPYYWKDFN